MHGNPREEPDVDTDADVTASVFDFVSDFLDDQSTGEVRPLGEYQKRYPGAEAAIALEYDQLSNPDPVEEEQETRFIGNYRLIRELGRGGQGSVWLAEDQNLHRQVALKLLNSWLIAGERLARFQREAESIARLEHEGLAVVYEAQMESDPPFIAMRFVKGDDLSSCLAKRDRHGLPFLPITSPAKLRQALHFFEHAARALHVAHEAGVMHRDIKPGNILVSAAGRPVITDFGLARDEFMPGEETITQEGEVFGTPAYMSPEQVDGRAQEVDRRTDVWSLGATLFEALCGRAPFQGKGQLGLARAILEDPPPVATSMEGEMPIGIDVQVVLQTALERDLSRRYPSALALAEDLRRIRQFEPIQARPAGPWLRVRRWARREPAWASALGLLLTTLIIGLVVSLFTIERIQGLLEDKEVALGQERALRYVRQMPQLLQKAPSLALATGLEAVSMHDSWITRSSLYGPLEELTLRARGKLAVSNIAWDACFLGNGDQAVVVSGSGGVAVVQSSDGEPIATRIIDGLDGSKAPDIRHVRELPGQKSILVSTSGGRVLRLALTDLHTEWEVPVCQGGVLSLALFSDGEHLMALTENEGAKKLRTADGSEVATLAIPPQSASLVLIPEGTQHVITTGSFVRGGTSHPNPRASLWNTTDGSIIREFAHSGAVRSAAIDQKGLWLSTGTLDGQVYTWSLQNLQAAPLIRKAQGPVDCIDISPDGESVAAGGEHGAWLWHGLEQDPRPLLGHSERVVDVGFSSDGEEFGTCSWDNVVRVFPSTGGAALRQNRAGYRPLILAWSKQGHRLLSAGIGRHFSLWNRTPPPSARRFEGIGSPLVWTQFTSDGRGAVATDSEGAVLWFPTPKEIQEGHMVGPLALLARHRGGAAVCAVSTRAKRAVSGGTSGEVLLHDLDTREVLSSNRGWVQGIRHLAIRPDGEQVAIVDGIGRLGTWDGSDRPALRPTGVEQQIQRVCFDVSGRLLAAGDALGHVMVWNAHSGELLHRFETDWKTDNPARNPVIDLTFDPEGETIHAAVSPWWALSWDLNNPKKPAVEQNRMALRWLKALPNKKGLLSCGTGLGTFSVGRSSPLSLPATRHVAPLSSMNLNTQGTFAATGCEDGCVLVWNVVTGATLTRYARHGGAVRHISFSPIPGDDRVLSVSDDGTLAIWPVNPIPTAQGHAPHELTDRNRKRFDAWGLAPRAR
ncbi:MAG: protein kinase [bacterium]|nr:protein kinase [bacterium]